MAERFVVKNIHADENRLLTTVSQSFFAFKKLEASGRMLVDSEQLAFIYIVDTETDYLYVEFQNDVWQLLYEGLENDSPVVIVKDGEAQLELKDFNSELAYLIDNIKNNPNYGEKMGTEVASIFV